MAKASISPVSDPSPADEDSSKPLKTARRPILILGTLSLLFFALFLVCLIALLIRETSRPDCSAKGVELAKSSFGLTSQGEPVDRFTFSNENGVSFSVITYGAIITEIHAPDKNGEVQDVVLGYRDQAGFDVNEPYFGAIVGRVVNRISGGRFELDGVEYTLALNDAYKKNHIHGGVKGFDKRVWEVMMAGDEKLVLKLISEDGDEGYPGQLTVYVTYELTNDNEIIIRMNATTTKPTPINLTNHAYFNLAGQGSSAIYDQVISIYAEKYLPSTEELLPTGEIKRVNGTEFDLRKPVRIGDVINDLNITGGGFDTNYCLNGTTGLRYAARVEDPNSGRVMEVFTNQPAIQFYTGNFLEGIIGKNSLPYHKHEAFCLETQNYPNAINHKDTFPDSVLRPRSTYEHVAIYKFSIAK